MELLTTTQVTESTLMLSSTVATIPEPTEKSLANIQLVFLILAFVMVALGLGGNLVIIISGLRLPQSRKKGITTGSRYYIINLALADVGVLVVASVTNLDAMLNPWSLGDFMCKMLLPMRDVFILVSLVTITTLSVERYWLITRPLQHQANKSVAKFILTCIWIAAYLVNGVPLLLVVQLKENGSCGHDYPSLLLMKVHTCFGIIIILVPFLVVTFCYIAIGLTLKNVYKKRSNTMLQGSDAAGNKHTVTLILRSKRLVRMLIVVVVAFAICNLPIVLYSLAHLFYKVDKFEGQAILFTFFQCAMVYESAINPFILLLMASEYRLCVVDIKKRLSKLGTAFGCCSRFNKELPDQPYWAILQDANLPATPV